MNQDDEQLLRTIIHESGEMWLAVQDRSFNTGAGVVICTNPERAFYLHRAENYGVAPSASIDGWIVEERPLWMADAEEFFAAFGSHWPYWSGAIIKNHSFRAFIKNGRKDGWSISLDTKTQPAVKAVMDDCFNNGPTRQMVSR